MFVGNYGISEVTTHSSLVLVNIQKALDQVDQFKTDNQGSDRSSCLGALRRSKLTSGACGTVRRALARALACSNLAGSAYTECFRDLMSCIAENLRLLRKYTLHPGQSCLVAYFCQR